MRVRKLTAAALAVLAVTGLTACKSKAGVAAVVDGHRISESDLSGYVTRTGPDPAAVAQAKAQNQELQPAKTTALSFLVEEQVFRRALAKSGDVPDTATLASLHDSAASMLLGTTLTGKELDDAIGKEAKREGLSRHFLALYLRTLELEKSLIDRVQAGTASELATAIAKFHISVSVNPRYGKWNPQRFSLDDPRGSIPSFVRLSTPASQAPAA